MSLLCCTFLAILFLRVHSLDFTLEHHFWTVIFGVPQQEPGRALSAKGHHQSHFFFNRTPCYLAESRITV